jgi:seryl-tRNA synthetase
MLDINFIRQNPKLVEEGIKAKGMEVDVGKLLEVDDRRRKLLAEVENLRAQRNKAAHDKDIEEGKELKEKIKKVEDELEKVNENFFDLILKVPNLPDDDAPKGKSEEENKVIKKWGNHPKFDFNPRDHLELGESLDIIDVLRSVKISSSRFGSLKNTGALLEFALAGFALEELVEEGFIPIVPPVLVNQKSMEGTGYLSYSGDLEVYHLEKDNLYLVGTAEQSIGPMHQDEIFQEKELPKRYTAFSSCFRREAGSYGKDTRGIFRVHQFDKVEMFSFCLPKDSQKEHKFFLELEEKLVQKLKLPYRVLDIYTADLGFVAARKFDIECFLPSQGRFRETHSTSNARDFQSRRLNIKYKDSKKTEFVHTVNGTAFAIGRMVIAILENYQQKDGTVKIPDVLQKYIGIERISPKTSSRG